MTVLDRWAAEDGPFADNTSNAITAKTFRDFAGAVNAALEEVRISLGLILSEIADGSTEPSAFHIDPDKPESGWVIQSKSVLDALKYTGDPWTEGQHITLKTGRSYYWDGSAWVAGRNTEE
jgi:hypothetical protein